MAVVAPVSDSLFVLITAFPSHLRLVSPLQDRLLERHLVVLRRVLRRPKVRPHSGNVMVYVEDSDLEKENPVIYMSGGNSDVVGRPFTPGQENFDLIEADLTANLWGLTMPAEVFEEPIGEWAVAFEFD